MPPRRLTPSWDRASRGSRPFQLSAPRLQCHSATSAASDVSAVADPKTGLAVYDTFGYDGWLVVGGTSLSSPIVASIYAMAGNTANTRYATGLYRADAGLFDVVGGSNGLCGECQRACGEQPGECCANDAIGLLHGFSNI